MKKLILGITGLLLLLSSCGNMIDLSNEGTVNIKLANDGNSRYIAGENEDVEEAILGFIEKDVMYNFDFIEEVTDFNGQYLFTGIPVGDYSFLAMLMGKDDNDADRIISMAIQPVTIEAGSNVLEIAMGPGFSFNINDLDLDMGDLGEEFTLSLSGNEVTIGVSSEIIEAGVMTVNITSNAYQINILDNNGTIKVDETPLMPTELTFHSFPFEFNPAEVQSFTLKLKSFDDSINEYVLIFKEK